ncbi:MAG: STAS domain-containing protein [Planctomycetota bacterium]
MAKQPMYTIETYGSVIWFQVLKDRLLDTDDIAELGQALMRQTDLVPKISLVLEMQAVTHMSSAMLGKLVALHKKVTKVRGRMCICGLGPSLMPLFKVTKLHKVFDLQPSAQDMILMYKRKPL